MKDRNHDVLSFTPVTTSSMEDLRERIVNLSNMFAGDGYIEDCLFRMFNLSFGPDIDDFTGRKKRRRKPHNYRRRSRL
jgi:hypothetical protein